MMVEKSLLNLKGIKNIIFDLGGVILNIDYQKTIDAFKILGIEDFEKRYSQAQQTKIFDDIETGRITPKEFIEGLRSLLGTNVTDEQIINAWNAMLLDFPEKRLKILTDLKDHYRVFLLSNTNEIHYRAYCKQLQDKFKVPNLSSYFEKEYYSHEIGLRKPDLELFQLVLSENNLNRTETIFIDDSIQHVIAADKLGIRARLLKKEEDLMGLFEVETYDYY